MQGQAELVPNALTTGSCPCFSLKLQPETVFFQATRVRAVPSEAASAAADSCRPRTAWLHKASLLLQT